MVARISAKLASALCAAREELPREPKRSKFGAKKTAVGDLTFASGREARRYCELRILQAAGKISDLKLQPRFPLTVNGKLVCTYVGDFDYLTEGGERVIEDSKGYRTREFILKAKLFAALHGFSVREV